MILKSNSHSGTAEYWFLRMRDKPDAATEAEFHTWMKNSANAEVYDQCEALWALTHSLAGEPLIEQYKQQITDRRKHFSARRSWFYLPVTAIASVAVAIVLVFFPKPEPVRYQTAVGEQKQIVLEDGSTVMLNTNSEIIVSYVDDARRLLLQKGEAVFSVVSNKTRPFIVSAGARDIIAVGTLFNVGVDSSGVTVAVLEGKVGVTEKSARPESGSMPTLIQGQQLSYDEVGTMGSIKKADMNKINAWTRGYLDFNHVPLADAVVEYNRYTQTPIVIGDPSIANIPISGMFRVQDGAAFISALENMLKLRAQEQGNTIVLRKAE